MEPEVEAIKLGGVVKRGGLDMFKINWKKYISFNMLCKLALFAVILVLCACSDSDSAGKGSGENANKQADCWQTYIISAVLKIIDQLFVSSAQKVVDGGPTVIMMGFAVWMAFKMLKVLPSFKEENLGEVWTEIGQQLFLCAFCAWMVSSIGDIKWGIETFVIPIYQTFLELASRILEPNDFTINLGWLGRITFSSPHTRCESDFTTLNSIKNNIMPMTNCIVCLISSRLGSGIRIGISLLGSGFASSLVGLSILLFFTCAKFGFVLYLVDSLFRLNFAVILVPLMMMGIPFQFTRKWVVHCFLMFINSSGIMFFIGLLVALAIGSLQHILAGMQDATKAAFNGLGPSLMAMFLISLLLLNIPGLGVTLADKFVGGGGDLDFQKKISKFVMRAAKKIAATVLSAITEEATQSLTDALEKYDFYRDKIDTIKQVKTNITDKLNKIAGYNDDEE